MGFRWADQVVVIVDCIKVLVGARESVPGFHKIAMFHLEKCSAVRDDTIGIKSLFRSQIISKYTKGSFI